MAIFKVIEEQYVCENEVGNLVNYILKLPIPKMGFVP